MICSVGGKCGGLGAHCKAGERRGNSNNPIRKSWNDSKHPKGTFFWETLMGDDS